MKVKISREARILMGLMFAAAAVLVWINFFTQQRQGFGLFGNQSTLSSPTVSSSPSSEYVAPEAASSVLPDTSVLTPDVTPDATSTDASASSGVTAIDPTAIGVNSIGVDSIGVDSAASSTDVTAVDPTVIDPTAIATEASTEATVVDASVIPSGDVVSSTDVAEVASTELTPEVSAVTPDAGVIAEPTVATTDLATEAAPVTLPTVVAPTAARDIELAELPFLVTELPVSTDLEGAESAATLEVARPGEQRASINPFAPIVLAPVEVEAVALPNGQEIIEVPIPNEPTTLTAVDPPAGVETQTLSQAQSQGDGVLEPGAPVETVALETPLPEALTPAPQVASLPRPLPGGTLPVAPEILRTMSRTVDGSVPVADETNVISDLQPQVAEVEVAIRLPDQAPITSASAVEESEPAIIPEADDLDLQPVTGLASDIEATPNGGPIAAGLSGLSRYLRDNDVRFTGSVIGPVGVGIFRSTTSQAPYVITLGQSIPNTDIVLTSLQGKQAQFTQGQEIQSLTLDLRR